MESSLLTGKSEGSGPSPCPHLSPFDALTLLLASQSPRHVRPTRTLGTRSQRPDSGCMSRIVLPLLSARSTLHNTCQSVLGQPGEVVHSRRVQAAYFHPVGQLYLKPEPCCHKAFGCARFLVSQKGTLPVPLPSGNWQSIPCAGKWVRPPVGPWFHVGFLGSPRSTASEGLIKPQHLKAPCSATNIK